MASSPLSPVLISRVIKQGDAYWKHQVHQPNTVPGCEKSSDPRWELRDGRWFCLVDECEKSHKSFASKSLLCGHRMNDHKMPLNVGSIPQQKPGPKSKITDRMRERMSSLKTARREFGTEIDTNRRESLGERTLRSIGKHLLRNV